MRWLKWALVAGWLGVHALLWTTLPPVPRWSIPGVNYHGFDFTPDGRRLVLSSDKEVSAWDLATGRCEHTWPQPAGIRNAGPQSSVILSPDGHWAVVDHSADGVPSLIDLNTGVETTLQRLDGQQSPRPYIGPIQFLPDSRSFLRCVAKPNNQIALQICNLQTGPEREIAIPWDPSSVSVSGDGRVAVLIRAMSEKDQPTAVIVDLDAARVRHVLTFDYFILRAEISPDGTTVAISGLRRNTSIFSEQPVQLWNTETGQLVADVGGRCAAGWNPDGNLDVEDEASLRLIDPVGNEIARWPLPTGHAPFTAVTVSAGPFLISKVELKLSAAVEWLLGRLPAGLINPNRVQAARIIRDARTGRVCGSINADAQALNLAPDGKAFVAVTSKQLTIWDVPPRSPGGIVLGLMIAEVSLALAWTVWRCRRASRRKPDVGEIPNTSGLRHDARLASEG